MIDWGKEKRVYRTLTDDCPVVSRLFSCLSGLHEHSGILFDGVKES